MNSVHVNVKYILVQTESKRTHMNTFFIHNTYVTEIKPTALRKIYMDYSETECEIEVIICAVCVKWSLAQFIRDRQQRFLVYSSCDKHN